MNIIIDKLSTAPIYLQIVQQISKYIETGELQTGDKLPTVRELSAMTGISRGTIKHAYDALERSGIIQMTQGKGTFVTPKDNLSTEIVSKKNHAMKAIDALIDELQGLSFSPKEIEIYMGLKLRERDDEYERINIAIVDCNAESLVRMTNQLSDLPNVEIVEYYLEDVLNAPFKLAESYDLILTTATHYNALCEVIPEERDRIVKLALTESHFTIMQLAQIPSNADIGIWCKSGMFARIIRKKLILFKNIAGQTEYRTRQQDADFSEFIISKAYLIVPMDYLSFCDVAMLADMKQFRMNGGAIIQYDYSIDKGSMMYIKERVQQSWQSKQKGD